LGVKALAFIFTKMGLSGAVASVIGVALRATLTAEALHNHSSFLPEEGTSGAKWPHPSSPSASHDSASAMPPVDCIQRLGHPLGEPGN
jgi:hypothetical protein